MANKTTGYSLPHENLIAYQVACQLLVAIVEARIRDPGLRDQALRAAKSACLNIAEANGRQSPADRKRVFAIARGEALRGGRAGDGFAPAAYGRSYCAAIPGAKFEEIAESGHFPHMEQPEAVARRVIEFGLDRQAAPA